MVIGIILSYIYCSQQVSITFLYKMPLQPSLIHMLQFSKAADLPHWTELYILNITLALWCSRPILRMSVMGRRTCSIFQRQRLSRSIHTNCSRRLSRLYFNEAYDADISLTKNSFRNYHQVFCIYIRHSKHVEYLYVFQLQWKTRQLIPCVNLGYNIVEINVLAPSNAYIKT